MPCEEKQPHIIILQLQSEIINGLASDRVGIIAYAGQAYPQLPITTDYGAAKMFLQSMNTDMLSSQGTAINEAIELVNTRNYANASCIYTGSGAAAREFKYRVKPSMVGINIGIAAPMSFFPFGGAGNSMFGDTKGHGQEIFNFFTDTKVVIQRWF